MPEPIIVLDANIIIRAVLGSKVRNFIIEFHHLVNFITPDICIKDAEKYLPILFKKKKLDDKLAHEVLSHLKHLLQIIDEAIYQGCASRAQKRMKYRDIEDWPVVATALTFDCPIWTEDHDFFGTGIPTWTTDQIQLYFDSLKN